MIYNNRWRAIHSQVINRLQLRNQPSDSTRRAFGIAASGMAEFLLSWLKVLRYLGSDCKI